MAVEVKAGDDPADGSVSKYPLVHEPRDLSGNKVANSKEDDPSKLPKPKGCVAMQ